MADAALAGLARRLGIDTEFEDVWGEKHAASDDTLRALIKAMHVDAASAEEVAAAIANHDRARWSAVLPAALVVKASLLATGVRVQLPAALTERTLAWRITEETGRVFNGSFRPRNLTALETFTLDGEELRAVRLPLSPAVAHGYHRLEIREGIEPLGECALIVAPERCYLPEAVANGGRVWGGALQLYSLRSVRNWGIGDYTDLALAVAQWGGKGASLIGVNPLHALFAHAPAHASPYSPSSRLFLNVLYLDIEAIADFSESDAAREAAGAPQLLVELKRLRAAELVDYAGVAAAKRTLLEILYANFRERHLARDSGRAGEFRAYCTQRGEALRRYALFEAIYEWLNPPPQQWGWQQWPAEYRDPAGPAVAEFARRHAARVEFFEYLQWQAELQIAAVEERCFDAGLAIGLYTDLAVSVDPGGAETWANPDLYAKTASVGAPPDEFNMSGQDWGLPPPLPEAMRDSGYASLIATVRSNMVHAGALRIDHVMGLARLYWVPAGMSAREGAYVRYPFEAALGILALESHRNRCIVVGEDLGTVPQEVSRGLADAGVLSYKLLIFEHDAEGRFKPPAAYPRQALAAVTTHDLPTVAGYWRGRDIELRQTFGQFPDAGKRRMQIDARARERAGVLAALAGEHLLPPGATADPASLPEPTTELMLGVHEYLARTPAMLMIAQLEDAMEAAEQANLPSTIDEHPNWRRKLPLTLEQWETDARFAALASRLAAQRPAAAARVRPRRRAAGVRIPRATYRLQLNRSFTFNDATRIVSYLAALGVSHVYCSPYLRARSGSTHGYDIVDHSTLNPEIGTAEDFERFTAALAEHDMGQLVDVVPNHMGVMGADNGWWLDVLENGQASVYADFFDIDWQSAGSAGRVLVPVLGDHYGAVLAAGELVLKFAPDEGTFSVYYHEHRLPIDPREYPRILARALGTLERDAADSDAAGELKTLVAAFCNLPPRSLHSAEGIAARAAGKQSLQRGLAELVRASPPIGAAIEAAVQSFGAAANDPASVDALHELLEAQAYRVAFWRVASDEINYRRFFDINDLAALRMENEAAFEATHRKIFDWLRAGTVDSLRIDHVDGLFDPAAYCRRLQDRYRQLGGPGAAAMAADPQRRPLYVVTEKIIAAFEDMPQSWGVYGTTGYRFAALANGVLVDTAAEQRITRTYESFTGDHTPFSEIIVRSKHLIMRGALASELMVLANRLARIAHANRNTRDYTVSTLRQSLAEVVARFPVYRTYIAPDPQAKIEESDRRYIEWAVALAKRHTRAADVSIFDFIKSVLLCEADCAEQPAAAAMRAFACRFQQLTSPVMAKGVEDTAMYIYNRLVSLNDVGGEPATFGVTVGAFHGASIDRATNWPATLLATSTHDNKRSEDVRARIDVLSEFPAAWQLGLRRWARMNRSKKREVDGEPAPSRNDEYLLYQILIGTFPTGAPDDAALEEYRGRIERYMLKAVREAKVHTSWITPAESYEEAVRAFVAALLKPGKRNLFLEHFRESAAPFAWLGMLNSLSMTLLKYTSPGVPDCYQGCEFFDFSLVDPDNRRPVDYAARGTALVDLAARAQRERRPDMRELFAGAPGNSAAKLHLIWRLLMLRRARSSLFLHGGYTPLNVAGARERNIITFARRYAGSGVIAIAGRMFGSLDLAPGHLPCGENVWGDTRIALPFLAEGTLLRHAISGETARVTDGGIRVALAFADFPGAVYEYERGEIGAASK